MNTLDWKTTLMRFLIEETGIHGFEVDGVIDRIEIIIQQVADEARGEEKASKDEAYKERNLLVQALTKLFPAYLARHDEADESWERDWMWIVYIDLPTGQVSWHIHDSERHLFDHLTVKENNWDGHNTQRKYERLQALCALTPPETSSSVSSAPEAPHYEKKAEGPKWVYYKNGVYTEEPYMHQDEMYSNMCASPRYCRCTE